MQTFEEEKEEFLSHYGTKGMRWGKRTNPNYSDQQIKRDMQVYGSRGASKINKSLNNGNQISVARGDQKTRRDRVIGKNKYVRQGGKVAGAVGGIVAVNLGLTAIAKTTTSRYGRAAVEKIFGNKTSEVAATVGYALTHPLVRIAASTGGAKVGSMMAGDATVAANMRLNGYDPNRKY